MTRSSFRRDRIDLYGLHGIEPVALGISRNTFAERLRDARARGFKPASVASEIDLPKVPDEHAPKEYVIALIQEADRSPFHGPPHVDDNGCKWLEEHVRICRETDGCTP